MAGSAATVDTINVTPVTFILTPRTNKIAATQLRGTERQMEMITAYHSTYPGKESLA
jgi:hypothetical protein